MRMSQKQLRCLIREAIVSASHVYTSGPEAAMALTQKILSSRLSTMSPSEVAVNYESEIEKSITDAGVENPAWRSMIFGALKMIPPHAFIRKSNNSQP